MIPACVRIHPRFTRSIRTRASQIKLEKKHKETESTIQTTSTSTTTPSLRRRSKFNDETQSIIQQLSFKPRSQIENELTQKFKADGIEIDTNFISKLIDQSESEKKLVKEYVSNPKSTLKQLNNDEINHFIDWIIEDAQKRLKQKLDKSKSRTDLNEFLTTPLDESNPDPEHLTNAFINAQQLAIDKSFASTTSSFQQLPVFLKHLNKLSNIDIRNSIPLQKYVALYETSVQLDAKQRDQCVYLSGKLLYESLRKEFGVNARPDPINEKFFIESCLTFEDFPRALQLWDSRRTKDVSGQKFWKQLGITVKLAIYEKEHDVKALDDAVELVNELRRDEESVDASVLVDAMKKCFEKDNFEDALWFWEEMLVDVENDGVSKDNVDQFDNTIFFNDEGKFDDVLQYYNKNRPVSWDMLLDCLFACISKMKFELFLEMLTSLNFNQFNEFLVYFVQSFSSKFGYPGRELFLKNLESLKPSEENEDVLTFLIEEIQKGQNIRCESVEEAKLLDDIDIFLNRLSVFKNKDSAKIDDLHDIIRSGDRLTLFDTKNMLKLLLDNKSKHSFQLACKILNQMNLNKVSGKIGIFPVADASSYAAIIRRLLANSNPRLTELSYFLNMMVEYDIKLDEKLANLIIMSLIGKKLFNEAVKFVQTYIFSDNPIAICSVDKKNLSRGKNVYTASLLAYSKIAVTGGADTQTFTNNLTSLRYFIKNIIEQNVDDEFTTQEIIGTLLNYGDYQSAIAVIQWYGSVLGEKEIKFDFMLAIKAKLEVSINKAEKYAPSNDTQFQKRLETYRLYFGVHSLINDFKEKPNFTWQEVAIVLYKYADLFGYKLMFSKHDPFSLLVPDAERNENRIRFDTELHDLQHFYNLPEWRPL